MESLKPLPPVLVLAAGLGRRLGGRKLELPWGDGTVLGATLDLLRAAGGHDLLVVLGPEPERLQSVVTAAGARWLVNPIHESGMLSSIQCGLTGLATAPAVLVHPADQPLVRPATVQAIAGAWRGGAEFVIPRHAGHGGHPVLLAAELFPLVAELDPTVGLRELRTRLPACIRHVDVDDPGICQDLDLPADYARWRPAAPTRGLEAP